MKKIELVLLAMVLRACSEAALAMVIAGQDEIAIPANVADFLCNLLGVHPELEVSNFYRHELEGLQ